MGLPDATHSRCPLSRHCSIPPATPGALPGPENMFATAASAATVGGEVGWHLEEEEEETAAAAEEEVPGGALTAAPPWLALLGATDTAEGTLEIAIEAVEGTRETTPTDAGDGTLEVTAEDDEPPPPTTTRPWG